VKVLVVTGAALVVLVVGLWLAAVTGLMARHEPNWSCVEPNMAGEPPPCAYVGE